MNNTQLIPHLFRTEFGKISSVLNKYFGLARIEIAEDIASETFVAALETWPYKGIPENPTAWLYFVAKNKAKNYLAREQLYKEKITKKVNVTGDEFENPEFDLSEKNILDSQLHMLFAVCHPVLSAESQIGLALRILCGFGINEIATAFFTNKEAINKRLFRAKEKLRELNISIEMPHKYSITERLDSVLTTLYLLFNEGYYSETNDNIIRKELSFEAMRLAQLLTENAATNLPKVNALLALMCFHASRFDARLNKAGDIVLYHEQDSTAWNQELIAKGAFYFHQSANGLQLSKYHLEAGIAYWHTIKEDSAEKWEQILQMYNQLLQIEYSPVAALNRTYSLAKAQGKGIAIKEAEKLMLTTNPYYFTLLGNLYTENDPEKAKINFKKALELLRTDSEKLLVQNYIDAL